MRYVEKETNETAALTLRRIALNRTRIAGEILENSLVRTIANEKHNDAEARAIQSLKSPRRDEARFVKMSRRMPRTSIITSF